MSFFLGNTYPIRIIDYLFLVAEHDQTFKRGQIEN